MIEVKQEKCRSCAAPIFWAENEKTGKMAPIDLAPDPLGNVVLVEGGKYGVLSLGRQGGIARTRYTNHFQTCPQATRWSHR